MNAAILLVDRREREDNVGGMKVYKRFTIVCFMMLCVCVLTGCHHDEKLAGSIYTNLEQSALMEKGFVEKQQGLQEEDQKEQVIYDKIMALDIDQADQIKGHIEDVERHNVERKQLLQEVRHSFEKAYKLSLTVKPNVKEIKDDKQKRKATAVVQLMEKRYDLFQSYCKQYGAVLKQDNHLYEQLKDEKMSVKDLDKEITKINQGYRDMEEQKQQFNDYTKKYNQAKVQYYQSSDLNYKRLKQKETS